MILLKSCLTCSLLATVKKVTVKGSQLIAALKCPNNDENIWKSQPTVNPYPQGHLTLPTAVLFSTNTFQRIDKYLTSPTFNGLQKLATTQFKGIF